MTEVLLEKDTYLANFVRFEKELAAEEHSPVHRLRKAAIERFAELGFPSSRNEDWKFTSLASLAQVSFQNASRESSRLNAAQLDRVLLKVGECSRLVFVNGRYARELSEVRSLPESVIVANLAAMLEEHPDKVEPHLAQYADWEDHPFTALNTAFLHDGAFVSIPKNTVVREPIHLVFVSTTRGQPTVSHPRCLILAAPGSQASIIESYVGLGEDVYFTNGVTEVAAADNAVIEHYELVQENNSAFHIATLQVHQGRSSNFTSHCITLRGGLVRNETNAVLDAEGCECTLNGLYLASGKQHIDNHTVIDHARAHCASHELFKGILDGKAHGVFNGKIFVRQDAQKTDAKQTNKTLLLSDDAVINTKPQLEIYADDVKCTHGATVGQLDAESIFYLRSRGIGLEQARSLLTYAFANDVIGRMKIAALRSQLEKVLLETQHLPLDPVGQEVL